MSRNLLLIPVFAFLTVASCGKAIVDPPPDNTPGKITTTEGGLGAAAAVFSAAKVAGETATNAKVADLTRNPGITGFTFGGVTTGTWIGAGTNSETILLTFYRAEGGARIKEDITDGANYNSGGVLVDLCGTTCLNIDVDKVNMKLEISADRTLADLAVSKVRIDISTGVDPIPFATGPTALYELTVAGSATLTNGSSITINDMAITVTDSGASVSGTATLSVPMDDASYTVTCAFDETGCTSGTITDASAAEVGTISVNGDNIEYYDNATSTSTVISW